MSAPISSTAPPAERSVQTPRSVSICLLGAALSPNTRSLVEAWARLGHKVHVVSLHGGQWGTVPVSEIDASRITRKLRFWTLGARVRDILERLNPDVLVGYHITSYGLLAARTRFRPLVLIAAGGDILPQQYGGPFRRLIMPPVAEWSLSRADRVFSWAEHMTQRLCELGVPAERVVTLPRGVDLSRFEFLGENVARPPGPLRVISTRGLKRLYGTHVLLEALAILRRRGCLVEATIVGNGPERARLGSLCARLGLERHVQMPGACPPEEIVSYLRQSDVYVSLCASDGVSCSLLEAMAVGVFPVVADVPANRVWIDGGKNGLLVPVADPGAVAAAIVKGSQDGPLKRETVKMNRKIVEARADLFRNASSLAQELVQLAS